MNPFLVIKLRCKTPWKSFSLKYGFRQEGVLCKNVREENKEGKLSVNSLNKGTTLNKS